MKKFLCALLLCGFSGNLFATGCDQAIDDLSLLSRDAGKLEMALQFENDKLGTLRGDGSNSDQTPYVDIVGRTPSDAVIRLVLESRNRIKKLKADILVLDDEISKQKILVKELCQ